MAHAWAVRHARQLHAQYHVGLETLKILVEGELKTPRYLKKAFQALTKLDVGGDKCGCAACAEAHTDKKHTNKKNKVREEEEWSGDASGPLPPSRYRNTWLFVWVDGDNWGEVGFDKSKAGAYNFTTSNYLVWAAASRYGFQAASTDRGGEYTSKEFEGWLKQMGIRHRRTAPDSSAGPAETKIRTLKRMARAYLNAAGVSDLFWDEAVAYANDVANMMPASSGQRKGQSPWSARFGEAPPLHRLHAWGCLAFAHLPHRKTFGNSGRRCIFMGLARNGDDGFRFYDPETQTVFHSRSATFLEDVFPGVGRRQEQRQDTNKCYHPPCAEFPDGQHHRSCSWAQQQEEEEYENEEAAIPDPVANADEVHGSRARQQTMHFDPSAWQAAHEFDQQLEEKVNATVTSTLWSARRGEAQKQLRQKLRAEESRRRGRLEHGVVPRNIHEALASEDKDFWAEAIEDELASHQTNRSMRRMVRHKVPPGRKTVRMIWVFDIKMKDGEVERYKARLCVQGTSQVFGQDFFHTWAPTPLIASVRFVLALALAAGMQTHHMDVSTAFLVPSLPEEETVYVEPPPGLELSGDYVYQLLKCVYGLKQSAAYWYKDLAATLLRHNFAPAEADPCVFIHKNKDGDIDCILTTHVDDILISAGDEILAKVKSMLSSTYSMKDLGEVSWYLGVKITYGEDGKTVSFSQASYVRDLLETYGMEEANPVSTPARKDPLQPPDGPMSEEERYFMRDKPYRALVGALLYLALATRPDISFAVSWLTRWCNEPRKVHWQAAQQVLAYLKGTQNYGLTYTVPRDGAWIKAVLGWSDSDWAGDRSDRRSTSGYVFLFCGAAVDWKCTKQTGTARSSAEAELVALDTAIKDALWFRKLQADLYVGDGEPITVYEDNSAARIIASENRRTSKTKHIDTKYFAVCQDVAEGRVAVEPVRTDDNLADLFTKGLERTKFQRFRQLIGVVPVATA